MLFDYLKKHGLIRGKSPAVGKIVSLSKKQLLDHAENISVLSTTPIRTPKLGSEFRHSAAFSLSGSGEDCYNLKCRQSKLESLLRFSVLYSDVVYIRNYFVEYSHREDDSHSRVSDQFINDMTLLMLAKPAIEGGYVQIPAHKGHLCAGCLGRMIYSNTKNAAKRVDRAFIKLSKDYLNTSKATIIAKDGNTHVRIKGDPSLYEHGQIVAVNEGIPEYYANKKNLLKRLLSGDQIPVSKQAFREMGFHNSFASQNASNICFEVYTNKLYDSVFLTDKDSHIKFLGELTNDDHTKERNLTAFKNLTTLMPLGDGLDLENAIQLRRREAESFQVFRRAINKSIDEYSSQKKVATPKIAKEIYRDIIAPELAGLERNIKLGSRDLRTSALRSLVGMVGTLSFGAYSGFIGGDVVAIANAVGLAKFGNDFTQKIMALQDSHREIEKSEYYFLWKLQSKRK